uniref:OSJNBa0028M15.14 protein n=1 Tax=Oryza sativa subsp. japonica TaxID=39947 RepID=Q7XK73_ORYSJ|nr:OSJNBa0028M15.14 [Oryza sativa Japonica Group]
MSYYVDPRTSVPQYPPYPVYGHPPLAVARQVGGLGAQGSTTMTSNFFDDSVDPGINQGSSTSTMLVRTQVGEIIFPVYTTMPISTSPVMAGSESDVATTPTDSMLKDPPAEAENGTSTTSEPDKDPNTAQSCPSDKEYEPTRTTSEATRSWCPIHKTRKHTLQACWVFLDVQAEIRACREHGIHRTSPTHDVYCPIHKTRNHDLSSCKVLRSAMRMPPPKVQQSQISPRDADKERGAATISDRFVGVIDVDPHEPSVLHLLEDQASSSTSTPHDVYAIDGTSTSRGGNTETEDQEVTPAHHIRTINAILRETPYDPVLNDDLEHNAFEEAAARVPPEQPPTGGANGELPEQRASPRQATPPPRGTSDLRDHLNGRREARRTRDNENRSRHRVSSRRHENEEQGGHLSENQDHDNRHNRREHDNREQRMPGDTRRGCRRNDDDDGDQCRDNNGLWQQFVANFQGTYKRHTIEDDLHALTQNPDESLRDYIRCFNECRNTIPEITDASVIRAFKSGVRDHYTTQELVTRRITTARKLFEIVDCCAHENDALRRKNDKPKTGGEKKLAKDAPESSKKKSHRSGKRKAQTEVLVVEYVDLPKHPDPQGDDTKKIWCPIHKSDKHSQKGTRKATGIGEGQARRYPIVVEPTIRNIKVARVLIDGGSSINLLFASTLDAMGIPRSELTPTDQPFHGITSQSSSKPLGKITLRVTFGQANNFRTEQITFDVAEFDIAYNAISGRTALVKFMATSHYAYQVFKMPGPKGTITIQGNAKLAVQCDKRSLDMVEHTPNPPATAEPLKKVSKTNKTPKPDGAIKIVPLSSANPGNTVKIRASLDPSDMPGVPREVIEHKLMVRPDAKPVKQKLWRFAPDRKQAIREELDKLLKASFIREVLHPEWLANPVMVCKANGKWRMCVDFIDLNKACPKDHFPLPRIDQLVDSTAGCELLSFLDAYSGYHQISMAKEDEEKTAFITPFGVFCYIKMLFGLITAGNTFQRTVQGALNDQLGNNVEAYIDDIVVKTKTSDSLIDDLRETFDNLRRYCLMLNPEKCMFGVPSGKLLGFLVSGSGIEANPEKIKAIENMKSPTRLKEVQKLTGCMAALSRFVARMRERGQPFFALLKKQDKFL